MKHLEIRSLHVQDLVQRKFFVVHKVKGEENPADLGTKYLTRNRIKELRPYKSPRRTDGWTHIILVISMHCAVYSIPDAVYNL